jgi:hypothetical protein
VNGIEFELAELANDNREELSAPLEKYVLAMETEGGPLCFKILRAFEAENAA